MKNDLHMLNIRIGSTENFKFSVYNAETKTQVIDFTGYDLNFFILKKDEDKTVVKQIGSEPNSTDNTLDVLLSTNDTKNIPSGEYYWMVVLKYPNLEQKIYVGNMNIEWGKVVATWL